MQFNSINAMSENQVMCACARTLARVCARQCVCVCARARARVCVCRARVCARVCVRACVRTRVSCFFFAGAHLPEICCAQATGFGYTKSLPTFSFANTNATNAYFEVLRHNLAQCDGVTDANSMCRLTRRTKASQCKAGKGSSVPVLQLT